jgi:hypothetical protein
MTNRSDKWEDQPLPKKAYCCAHSASCAVHQPPFDARIVSCTCTEKHGRGRHKYSSLDPQLFEESRTAH